MFRFDVGRGAALRVALGAIVAALCATPAAEAKIFGGKLGNYWRAAHGCRPCVQRGIATWQNDFCADFCASAANAPAIVEVPLANGCCGVYVADGAKTSLFNGVDLTGWTNVEGGAPGEGWKVVDGTIHREKNAGDLYFDGKFENFILEFEFKISEKGNSGVKYRSWNTKGYGLGCEYQIYDDINDAKNPPRYQTASLYDVVVPREGTSKIKMGEFNRGKIVVLGDRIEHYLNDELIVAINVGTPEWNELVGKSKFKDVKEFGTTTLGRIFLQDHGCKVWFKEIYVTKMKQAAPVGPFGRIYVY